MKVADKEVSKYEIAEVDELEKGFFRVKSFVEKPSPEKNNEPLGFARTICF